MQHACGRAPLRVSSRSKSRPLGCDGLNIIKEIMRSPAALFTYAVPKIRATGSTARVLAGVRLPGGLRDAVVGHARLAQLAGRYGLGRARRGLSGW